MHGCDLRTIGELTLVKKSRYSPADVRPEHGPGVPVGLASGFHLERGVAEESQRGVRHGVAFAKRHEQAAPFGQDLFGVQVGGADHGAAGRQGIRQGAAGNLVFSRIGGDVHVASLQVLQQVGKAEILVHEAHVRADAQRFGHLDQAFAVDFALVTLDLRVGDAHDQVNRFGTSGDDPGHGLDHVFQPLASIDEPEGANHPPARQPQPGLLRAVALIGDLRHSVRNHPHLRPGHAVDAVQAAARRPWS